MNTLIQNGRFFGSLRSRVSSAPEKNFQAAKESHLKVAR